jgi:hypothetical protein
MRLAPDRIGSFGGVLVGVGDEDRNLRLPLRLEPGTVGDGRRDRQGRRRRLQPSQQLLPLVNAERHLAANVIKLFTAVSYDFS